MVAIKPQRWRAPRPPERFAQAESLVPLPELHRVELAAPSEDVVLDGEGRAYAGLENGDLVRIAGTEVQVLGSTGGRPLGLEWSDGELLVCDAERGLLRFDLGDGALSVLADAVDGVPIRFASNVVRAPDGTLYFTDSTTRHCFADNMAEVLEHSSTGRLLRLVPGGDPEVLVGGLKFANGLALAADASYAVVVETFGYRLARHWLTGPRAGETDRLVENLPGIPDNLSLGSDGLFWVALSIPRNPMLDRMLALPGVLRKVVNALPESAHPQPSRTVWVAAYDDNGRLVHDLQATVPAFHLVTGVAEQDGRVHLSSLEEAAIAWFDLPTGG